MKKKLLFSTLTLALVLSGTIGASMPTHDYLNKLENVIKEKLALDSNQISAIKGALVELTTEWQYEVTQQRKRIKNKAKRIKECLGAINYRCRKKTDDFEDWIAKTKNIADSIERGT